MTPERHDTEKGGLPAEVLTNEGAQRHTSDQRNSQSQEDQCNGRAFFFRFTRSVAMVEAMAKKTPWARPVMKRATTRLL